MENHYVLKFEKTVFEMILLNDHLHLSKLDLFIDFHRNSCTYYDNLCDALYELSCGHSCDSLWISPSGNVYLAQNPFSEFDCHVLSEGQIPVFIDDLYEQIEAALNAINALSAKNSKIIEFQLHKSTNFT